MQGRNEGRRKVEGQSEYSGRRKGGAEQTERGMNAVGVGIEMCYSLRHQMHICGVSLRHPVSQ